MSQLVTRCPHCSTPFHVNEQQLRAARGAVRCGSCLQVFRADENIVFDERDQPEDRSLEALLEDDDFLIHDDMDLEGDEPAPPGGDTAKHSDKTPQNIEGEPLIDEAFGESQWQELAAAPSVDFEEDDDEDSDDILLTDEEDTPWDDTASEPPARREPALSTRPEPQISGSGFSERQRHAEPRATAAAPRENAAFSSGLEREQLISAIEPEPLEVAWSPRRERRIPGWLWTLTALLLAVGILAQIAYFRFDSLSKQQPWRDFYALICPMLNCELPQQLDLQAIRTSNLVVRSHPQIQGALVVDAVLLNTAPFDQPFPNLLLRFSDLKNQPVASRLFGPRDYLQGELAGRQQMPSGNPVHIAIDIVDPGREAVNYELRIAP